MGHLVVAGLGSASRQEERRAHPHSNGNGQCGSAHPIERHPPAHLGSDHIVRLTSAVTDQKADDGRPEI